MEIIPGLPKDLAVQCLARVPYKFNRKLMAVSKSWNALLTSAHFFKERQRRGDYEEVAVFLYQSGKTKSDFKVSIYSHLGHCLEFLRQIPREFKLEYTDYYQSMFVSSTKLLLVLGLLNTFTDMEQTCHAADATLHVTRHRVKDSCILPAASTGRLSVPV
ncbi:hypothetical protein SUGI_0243790 [Cryptomeria japonica]|nr:hypothetical protein SUGI_0243790 [Cryptomeria japonica]